MKPSAPSSKLSSISKILPQSAAQGAARTHLTRVGALAAWISLLSLFYYLRRGEILMLGDTTAHINIARRVFDSLDPGLLQLGTVWLPLPHIVMIPFLLSDKMWQNGIGGSIPSMIAYVFGVVGVFRLTSRLLNAMSMPRGVDAEAAALAGAYIAAFAYGANPNLVYTQATALTEPLYLAFFIWALVYFADFLAGLANESSISVTARRALRRCAFCVACAELTRYDGWFLAVATGGLVAALAAYRWRQDRTLRWSALKYLLATAAPPALWLAYNATVFGNALAFANGPYSAKAIAVRVAAPIPGAHNPWVAILYFLKAAQIALAVGNWGRYWLLGAVAATAVLAYRLRRKLALVMLLLWSPLAFYALSIAYGSVALHVPMWWPFAVFNQRFGLELLPLFAVSAGALMARISTGFLSSHRWKLVTVAVVLIAGSYAFVLAAKPLCWEEAWRNWEMRRGLDTAVERAIKQLPPNSRFLMDIEEHVGIMERLGIPLRRVVNNEDHQPWRRPDPEGHWERALADPGRYVHYVIAFDGDLVDKGVNRANLNLLEVIHSSGQPTARIYQTSLIVSGGP